MCALSNASPVHTAQETAVRLRRSHSLFQKVARTGLLRRVRPGQVLVGSEAVTGVEWDLPTGAATPLEGTAKVQVLASCEGSFTCPLLVMCHDSEVINVQESTRHSGDSLTQSLGLTWNHCDRCWLCKFCAQQQRFCMAVGSNACSHTGIGTQIM